jgi:hypothetical protein
VVWEDFGFESTMVMTRVFYCIVKVFLLIQGNAFINDEINPPLVVID